MPIIKDVAAGSASYEGGVEPGDELVCINGEKIADVFDYRYHASACEVELLIRGADGVEWILEVEKPEDEDLGLIFDSELMDEPRPCRNNCVFCFINQLPAGMRKSLYFKDDDVRLSFINGNYVTLTNVGFGELERLARYKMTPVNVSVHTADAALRAKMLGLKDPARRGGRMRGQKLDQVSDAYDILPKIRYLTESGLCVNAQIVLCKGYNDGADLENTLENLGGLNGHMRSVSVVPAGLTKYRDGLPPLEPFDRAGAADILRRVEAMQKEFRLRRGSRFVYAADEFYVLAGKEVPGEPAYEGYPQLENGVGMLALFIGQFNAEARKILKSEKFRDVREAGAGYFRHAHILTGEASLKTIESSVGKLKGILPALDATVVPVKNRFFGGQVTVTGLLTGRDIVEKSRELNLPPDSRILLSKTMLNRDSRLLLDDYTPDMLRKETKNDIIFVENEAGSLIRELLRR